MDPAGIDECLQNHCWYFTPEHFGSITKAASDFSDDLWADFEHLAATTLKHAEPAMKKAFLESLRAQEDDPSGAAE